MNESSTRTLEIWTERQRRELLKHVAVLPCPIRVAESLSHASLNALIHALSDRHGGYRLPANQRDTRAWKQLVAAGLVESGFGGIGTFGMHVRRVAINMKARGELG